MKRCPECGLVSPASAVSCDCGRSLDLDDPDYWEDLHRSIAERFAQVVISAILLTLALVFEVACIGYRLPFYLTIWPFILLGGWFWRSLMKYARLKNAYGSIPSAKASIELKSTSRDSHV
jgi:hypothetical protein